MCIGSAIRHANSVNIAISVYYLMLFEGLIYSMIHCKSLEDVYERERIVINNYNLHFLTCNLLRIFNFIYALSTHIHLFIILSHASFQFT